MTGVLVLLLMQAASAGKLAHSTASFDTLSRQAAEARDGKRFDEALTLYRKALQIKPDWADGWWETGSIEYDQDHYKECSADFAKLATLNPDQAAAWTMAGLCQYHLRNYEKALNSLQHALQLGFKEPTELARTGRLHLALVLIKLENFETAISTLLELTRIDHKSPEIIVASGIAGLRKPWTPPEVPEAERDKVYKLGDAMAAVMEQDTKEATEKFAVVLGAYPNDANVHFRYGAFLLQQDADRGIAEIARAVEIEPDHIPALIGLASVYLKREQPAQARQYAEKAVKLAPADFATHVTLGRVLLDADDAAGAARELETAVRLAPASPEAHFNLASAYAKLGRGENAKHEREEFRRLRQLSETKQP